MGFGINSWSGNNNNGIFETTIMLNGFPAGTYVITNIQLQDKGNSAFDPVIVPVDNNAITYNTTQLMTLGCYSFTIEEQFPTITGIFSTPSIVNVLNNPVRIIT